MALITNASLTVANHLIVTGFELPYCEFNSFEQEQVKSEDGRTIVGIKTVLRGRSLFGSADAYAQFRATGIGNRTANNSITRFQARIRQPGGAWVTLAEYTSTIVDDIGGPFVEVTATEVVGTPCIMVSFVIITQTPRPTNFNTGAPGAAVPVVGHTWKQAMRVGPDGRLVRVVNGLITCAPSAWDGTVDYDANAKPSTNSSSGQWKDKAPFPDLFREAIVPDVPDPTWRRTGQEYALAPAGNALAYQFTDEQFANTLPYPAATGDFEFRYERTQADAGTPNLYGRIEFACGLGGNVRQLVASAFDLMAARINPGRDIVLRMAITEQSIMGALSVLVEVEAFTYAQNLLNTTALPLAVMIGTPFTVVRPVCSITVPPYGSGQNVTVDEETSLQAWWMKPHWLHSELTFQMCKADAPDMAQALLYQFECPPCTGPVSITISNNNDFVAAMNTAAWGHATGANHPYPNQYPKQSDKDAAGGNVADGFPTTMVQGWSETRVILKPRIKKMSVAYSQGADYRFQIQKPVVLVIEKATVTRINKNPDKVMRPLPLNAIVHAEKWNVEPGQGDPMGARMYKGTFYRCIEICDAGGATSGGFTDASVGGITVRKFSPPQSMVLGAATPIVDPDTQSPLLAAIPAAGDVVADTKIASAITASPVAS